MPLFYISIAVVVIMLIMIVFGTVKSKTSYDKKVDDEMQLKWLESLKQEKDKND